ncbi:MAG: phospholipid/cholesterol/gamma-HCH transport system substrate-binding protein [Solirubrobacteraceae bacterium]|jgi:phospholipid/cholesterol/gamma-HCH transport system substrate-binding protein|nr:phospholipid/cholesterol/gamma-HCH transport system substrate-binding protein [Solirubrobacteraceae bacterium]
MAGALRVLGVALVAAVAVVLLTGNDNPYHYRVPLTNAEGLKDGGAVRIGGENRGKLELELTKNDDVIAHLDLKQPIGTDATVQVVAANFLGTKRIVIDPGNAQDDRAPAGFTVPANRVTMPTDLDQVLGVFDADTRTRMRILLDQAGTAVMGRRVDIDTLFRDFPIGLQDAQAILNDVATDNATMRSLLERSNRFVAEATSQRKDLGRLVDVLGATAATVNTRHTQLQQTLARAPHTLRTLRAFSQDLLETTQDLGPAAREIASTAPPLNETLAQVPAFRDAAEPTLRTAVTTAPQLSRLATGATPVLRRAQPAIGSLADLGEALPPVTDALDHSFDNLSAILQNWSRAIQFRDGMSHVFRGEFTYSPDAILGAINRLTTPNTAPKRQRHGHATPVRRPAAPPPATAAPAQPLPAANTLLQETLTAVGQLTKGLGDTVNQTTDGVKGTLDGLKHGVDQSKAATQSLLDFLLKP